MSASGIVRAWALAELPTLATKDWRRVLHEQLGQGAHVLHLSARQPTPTEPTVEVVAIVRAADGAIEASRASTTIEDGYHALTADHPAMHCFEREMNEATGLRLAGHPWLKPIRFARGDRKAMNDYPFYAIHGKEVHQVAVGPVHAGVIEPGSFRFFCHGEQVQHLEIHLGYQHRGVEGKLRSGDPRRLTPLVETAAGDTSCAHAWAYSAAIERLAGCALPLEAEVARAVALEWERIAMHLAGLTGLAADIGFLQGATTYGRLRTTAINTTMRLCGSRFGRGAIRPGGNAMALPADTLRVMRDNLQLLVRDLAIINDCFLSAATVNHRLRGVGVLLAEQARQIGMVGMAARASGVAIDTRQGVTDGAYHAVPIATKTFADGDCWARAAIRIAEIDTSIAWIGSALERFTTWPTERVALGPFAPSQLVVSVVEGWRGEVVHCVQTDADGALAQYKLQDPSLRNWMGLQLAVRHNEISDFPICNKSFDLSYCGSDL